MSKERGETTLNRRKLGRTGLNVSEISFGAWQLGNNDAWGGMDDKTAYNLVSEAIDRGINLFDTAPNYASGQSETLLGNILRGKREQVVLVSKFGHRPDGTCNFSVASFWESLEGSLARLQTDYLDVILLHNPPIQLYESHDPIWSALEQSKRQGKVRHYGASLDFAAEIELCLKNTESEVLEIFFNIFHQDVRRAFPHIRGKQTGVLAKVPLDSGWLTGRFNADSSFEGVRQRWSSKQIKQRAELVSSLDWLSSKGDPLAHKALAFLLSYQEVNCVIPGIRNHRQLLDNVTAADCVISEKERSQLETFWEKITDDGKNLLAW